MSVELQAGELISLPMSQENDIQAAEFLVPGIVAQKFVTDGFTCWSGNNSHGPGVRIYNSDQVLPREKVLGVDPRLGAKPAAGLSYNRLSIIDQQQIVHHIWVLPGAGEEIHFHQTAEGISLKFVDDLAKNLATAMIYIGIGEIAEKDMRKILASRQKQNNVIPSVGEIGILSWAPYGKVDKLEPFLSDVAVLAEVGGNPFAIRDDGYANYGDWLNSSGHEMFVHQCRMFDVDPAIWLGPYIAAPDSMYVADHPDRLLRSKGNIPDLSKLVPFPMLPLDPSLPEVRENAYELMKCFANMGYKMLKLDFHNVVYAGEMRNSELTASQYIREPLIKFLRGDAFQKNIKLCVCGPIGTVIDLTHVHRYGMDSLFPPNGGHLAFLKELTKYLSTRQVVKVLDALFSVPGADGLITKLTGGDGLEKIISTVVEAGEINNIYNVIYKLSMETLEFRSLHTGTLHEPNLFAVPGVSQSVIDAGLDWVLEMRRKELLGNICIGDRLSTLSPRQLRRFHTFVDQFRSLKI